MSSLFDGMTIGSLSLSNRIVRSATQENMARADGFPSEELAHLYHHLAKGGAGLLVTGHEPNWSLLVCGLGPLG
jgi:2,4-dienoyl-CoA reductase-like NADH-dependent reductase (Old Yellow Enzyme family)